MQKSVLFTRNSGLYFWKRKKYDMLVRLREVSLREVPSPSEVQLKPIPSTEVRGKLNSLAARQLRADFLEQFPANVSEGK